MSLSNRHHAHSKTRSYRHADKIKILKIAMFLGRSLLWFVVIVTPILRLHFFFILLFLFPLFGPFGLCLPIRLWLWRFPRPQHDTNAWRDARGGYQAPNLARTNHAFICTSCFVTSTMAFNKSFLSCLQDIGPLVDQRNWNSNIPPGGCLLHCQALHANQLIVQILQSLQRGCDAFGKPGAYNMHAMYHWIIFFETLAP